MKRILLFSDGTGNSSAKAQKTNVWRLFQAVDLTQGDQIAFYDDGVGSSTNRYLALLGGAFGWGLKRNVIDIYKFVCRNYLPGDEISGFGFSRGAFTIRVLVGLIVHEGLVPYQSEEQLDRDARAAYRAYRSERFPSYSPIVIGLRWLRDRVLQLFDWLRGLRPVTAALNAHPKIHFLGLWDTVAAYEIPINALKRAVSAALWPMLFEDLTLSTCVLRACHALSLDDARKTFHPLRWDEEAEARLVAQGAVQAGRLTQVWFAGVHCNVGGGYPEDRLSYVPLHWIMSEAVVQGIALLPEALAKIAREKSPYARLYDSRAGFAAFYRYAPRRIRVCLNTESLPILPIIDSSVLLRMADGTDSYAPVTLPANFCVLAPSDGVVPMPLPAGAPPPPASALPAMIPVPMPASPRSLAANAAALDKISGATGDVQASALEVVKDTIWWRSVAYLLMLAFAIALVVFPFYSPAVPACAKGPGCDVVMPVAIIGGDAIRYVLTALKGVLPSISTRWTDAFGANPDVFALLAAGLLISLKAGDLLKTRVIDRARMAWHAGFRLKYCEWCTQSARANRNASVFALAIIVPLMVASGLWDRHACVKTENQTCKNPLTLTTYELALVAVALALLLWRELYRLRVLEKLSNSLSALEPSIAQRLRTNRTLLWWYEAITAHLLPWTVVTLSVVAMACLVNRAFFDMTMATGHVCGASAGQEEEFHTNDLCWDSGVTLEKGARYQVTLLTDGDWFDASHRADVGGFGTDTLIHIVAQPLKRDWSENWFQPLARIGKLGDDEYVLAPVSPFAEHRYQKEIPTAERHSLPILASEAAVAMACDPTPPDRKSLVSQFTARSSGELFLYVNDAVLAPPLKSKFFYRNNSGSATVVVERMNPDGHPEPMPVRPPAPVVPPACPTCSHGKR
jgi:uncharacterized protein (DUF2235 family)